MILKFKSNIKPHHKSFAISAKVLFICPNSSRATTRTQGPLNCNRIILKPISNITRKRGSVSDFFSVSDLNTASLSGMF